MDLHSCTSKSIKGTSVRSPTTVARDAPEVTPKRVVDTAIATSKWLLPAIIAAGAASSLDSNFYDYVRVEGTSGVSC